METFTEKFHQKRRDCFCGFTLNPNILDVVYPYYNIARFICPKCNLIIGSIRFKRPRGVKLVGFRPLSI